MKLVNNCRSNSQIIDGYLKAGVKKSAMSTLDLFILGAFAGAFIAFGASCSMVAVHGIADLGLAKVVAGTIFPVGLMLIVLVGGELFTGDCLMFLGVMDKQYSVWTMLRKLAIIFLSNFVGAMIVVLLVSYSGQQDMGTGLLGAYTIKAAYLKSNFDFVTAVISGIGCNIIVCAAVLMAYGATDVTGKIWAIFFPILAFVISGFEHCVANMYYIPAGILAMTNDTYKAIAMDTYHLTAEQLSVVNIPNFLIGNLLPVTIGNMIGGMLFIGLPFYILNYKSKVKEVKVEEKVN